MIEKKYICCSAACSQINLESASGNLQYYSRIIIYQIHDSEEVGPVILAEPIRSSTEDIKLQPGDYMVIVSAFPTSKNQRNVSIHTSIPVSVWICDWNPAKIAGIMQKAVREMRRDMVTYREDVSIMKYEKMNCVVVMAMNYVYEKTLHVHTRCLKTEKCSLSRGTEDQHDFGDVIPPRSSQILVVRSRCFDPKQKGFPMCIEYFLSEEKVTKWRERIKKAIFRKLNQLILFITLF
ncbi:unnamed protein product [Caenorhabditis brenneri]